MHVVIKFFSIYYSNHGMGRLVPYYPLSLPPLETTQKNYGLGLGLPLGTFSLPNIVT